jgi:hypothetical protein
MKILPQIGTPVAHVRRFLETVQDAAIHDPRSLVPLLDMCHENVEWDASVVPGCRIYDGPQGVFAFFADYMSTWDEWDFEVQAIHSLGADVLVEIAEQGVSRESGVPCVQTHWQVWSFKGQLLRRWEAFCSKREAVDCIADMQWWAAA